MDLQNLIFKTKCFKTPKFKTHQDYGHSNKLKIWLATFLNILTSTWKLEFEMNLESQLFTLLTLGPYAWPKAFHCT
jgi:hypothetical protein